MNDDLHPVEPFCDQMAAWLAAHGYEHLSEATVLELKAQLERLAEADERDPTAYRLLQQYTDAVLVIGLTATRQYYVMHGDGRPAG